MSAGDRGGDISGVTAKSAARAASSSGEVRYDFSKPSRGIKANDHVRVQWTVASKATLCTKPMNARLLP